MKAALKAGADPNAALDNGLFIITPLNCVASGKQSSNRDDAENRIAVKIAKILFAAGAKLGPADADILYGPILSRNLEMLRLLIDKGASPTAKMMGNWTPTELALMNDRPAVYKYLISRGGIPLDRTSAAQIILIEAASNADIAAMERAIEEGAQINGTDQAGRTALISAVRVPTYESSRAPAVWWLLDHGADPNQRDYSNYGGRVPRLHTFLTANEDSLTGKPDRPDAKAMAEETLARLLRAGAKVSGKDEHGRTPLHIVASIGNVLAAGVLIAVGAKVMARDEAGKTPLDYAESGPMIKLLKASGATER